MPNLPSSFPLMPNQLHNFFFSQMYKTKWKTNDIVGYYDTYDLTLQKFQQIVHSYDWIQVLDIDFFFQDLSAYKNADIFIKCQSKLSKQ